MDRLSSSKCSPCRSSTWVPRYCCCQQHTCRYWWDLLWPHLHCKTGDELSFLRRAIHIASWRPLLGGMGWLGEEMSYLTTYAMELFFTPRFLPRKRRIISSVFGQFFSKISGTVPRFLWKVSKSLWDLNARISRRRMLAKINNLLVRLRWKMKKISMFDIRNGTHRDGAALGMYKLRLTCTCGIRVHNITPRSPHKFVERFYLCVIEKLQFVQVIHTLVYAQHKCHGGGETYTEVNNIHCYCFGND